MSSTPTWRRYLRLWGPDIKSDVDDELQFHLDMRTEELVEEGWAPEAARQEAERAFGDLLKVRRECTEIGRQRQRVKDRLTVLNEMSMDLRFAVRLALARPVFSIVVILSLALGIGANTAIFTVADRLLLDTLQVEKPHELVLFNWAAEDWRGFSLTGSLRDLDDGRTASTSFSYSAFQRFKEQQGALSSLFAFTELRRLNLNLDGEAVLGRGQLVSGTFFTDLGLRPRLGRLLSPSDDRIESAPVVVLDHSFWQTQCAADSEVIGKTLSINGKPFAVVGVATPGFAGTLQVGRVPAVYVPLTQHGVLLRGGDRSGIVRKWWIQIIGRLAPDVNRDQAQALLDPLLVQTVETDLGRSLQGDEQERKTVPRLWLTSGAEGLQDVREDLVDPLAIAFGISVLILILACTNAATLLLAGAESRTREVALRVSLGAGRFRIVRQLLTESILLALIGGLCGLVMSVWLSRLLATLLATESSAGLIVDLTPDLSVLIFALAVSVFTGLLFGLGPALRIPKAELSQTLREGGRGQVGATRAQQSLGRVLVIGQVALSLILLVVAGLFLRTLSQLQAVDPGFERTNCLLFRLDASLNGYQDDQLLRLYEQMRDGLGAVSGVETASLASFTPVTGSGAWQGAHVPDKESIGSFFGLVDPAYFESLRIPLIAGRPFRESDGQESPFVAVIDQEFARKAYGTEDPVGQEFWVGDEGERETYRVVGLIPSARNVSLRRPPGPTVLLPLRQHAQNLDSATFFVRTTAKPETIFGTVREIVNKVEPNVPLIGIWTMEEHVDLAMLQERQFFRLSFIAAMLAIVLACIGIYATVSYAVSRRAQEIGIRLSLGATRKDILLSSMRQMRMVVFGTGLGLVGAWVLARTIESQLFGLRATDPITLVGATGLLLSVAGLAVFVPSRRASRFDPMEVLRFE